MTSNWFGVFLPTSIIQSHQYSPSTLFYEMRENELHQQLLMKLIIDTPAHRPLYWWVYLHGTFISHRKCWKSLLFKINEKAGIIMSINIYMHVNHKRILYFWVFDMWFLFFKYLLFWILKKCNGTSEFSRNAMNKFNSSVFFIKWRHFLNKLIFSYRINNTDVQRVPMLDMINPINLTTIALIFEELWFNLNEENTLCHIQLFSKISKRMRSVG